jgi:transcription elongation factor GreB
MSRWRAPRPPASPYITSAGYRVLEIELKSLWERRAEVVQHLAAAAAEGDRSENADINTAKKNCAASTPAWAIYSAGCQLSKWW